LNPDVRKGNSPVKVWVTPDEKQRIKGNAEQHGLSASAFLRQIGLGYKASSVLDHQLVIKLAKINADQGRLGGLLKLWLTNDEKLVGANIDKINLLLQAIYQTQDDLLEVVLTLKNFSS
jgi:hypothetical protein